MTTVLAVLAAVCVLLVALTALRGPGARVSVDFTAGGTSILHLDRADPVKEPGQFDRIVRTGLDGDAPVTVYSGPRVQAFTTVGSKLAVATLDDDGESSIGIADPADPGPIEALPLPVAGTVGRMSSRDPSAILVFTIIAADQDVPVAVLYAVDLDGDDVPRPVLGLDGGPMAVSDWTVLPGGDRVAALTDLEVLLLADVAGTAPPVPFGRYTTLTGLSLDGTDLAVADVQGTAAVAVAGGTARRLQSSAGLGEAPSVYGMQLLSGSPVGDDPAGLPRLEQIAAYDPETDRYANSVVYDDGTLSRPLFEATDDQTFILGFSVSPSGQDVAVTFVTDFDASVSDEYAVDPYPTSVRTAIIEVATAQSIGEIAGFGVDW